MALPTQPKSYRAARKATTASAAEMEAVSLTRLNTFAPVKKRPESSVRRLLE